MSIDPSTDTPTWFKNAKAFEIWPKINVEKVAVLIKEGRMQAPGLAQVEAAKADGRWA